MSARAAVAIVLSAATACPVPSQPPRPPEPATQPPPPPEREITLEEAMDRAWQFDLPELDLAHAPPPRALWATSYYVPVVPASARGEPLLDPVGLPLGPRLSRRDWCEAAMEGTVVVVDAATGVRSTYNYATSAARAQTRCDTFFPRNRGIEKTRFRTATGPFGDGVDGMVLVPYRTMAVDPGTIPFGSVIYVPAARGRPIRLPNGEYRIHDGYFFAADRGGAIRGNHVDVFSGGDRDSALPFVHSRASATFDAYLVTDRTIDGILRRAHAAASVPEPLFNRDQ